MPSFVFFVGTSALRLRSVEQSKRESEGTVRKRGEVCMIYVFFG